MPNVVPLRNSPESAENTAPQRLWREAVGEQLRTERSERGERIADVAQRAGIAPQYLSEIERGRKDPSSEILDAVTGALDLRTSDLVTRAARRLDVPVCHSGPAFPGGTSLPGNTSSQREPVCLAA